MLTCKLLICGTLSDGFLSFEKKFRNEVPPPLVPLEFGAAERCVADCDIDLLPILMTSATSCLKKIIFFFAKNQFFKHKK